MMKNGQLILTTFLSLTLIRAKEDLHPFLYFSSIEVPNLKYKAKTTNKEIFARITKAAAVIKNSPASNIPSRDLMEFSGKWNEGYGNNLALLAMYCLLEERDTGAKEMIKDIIDAFISLPSWRVKALWEDDVPVAHTLIGMATAFDFLYDYFDSTRRVQILANITAVSREIYDQHKDSWGHKYIHNHIPTICVALLTSALIAEKHGIVEATKWKEKTNEVLNRTMFILSKVEDGSMNEGVAYGTYTSRSLTQYVFLAKRHMNIDLTNNLWLREHFWFMYRTILPGFRETVGIGDSNYNWFYGPESQLVFLDNFVNRNGYGNWLAGKIRKLREDPLMSSSTTQRFCTLHTEFLFYNASIPEKEPPNARTQQLHVFKDWGVVTYGGGTLDTDGHRSTFLSFKASVLHGKAVNEIVRTKPYRWINGFRDFNPGHEQPDQGSFVFAPYGVPFITEAYYGPKYTWLNNVLMFGPTTNVTRPSCFAPYEGQLGDCEKWLRYQEEDTTWFAEAEIIAAFENSGMVFISGEVSKWYNSSLGLTSVYRAVVLLHPGVLLVVDHVAKSLNSPIRYVGAFFHNRDKAFSLKKTSTGQMIGELVINEKTYLVLWSNSKNQQSIVHSQTAEYPAEYKTRKTHYLNITTKLKTTRTRLAYVFIAPGVTVTPPQLIDENEGVQVSLKINDVQHLVFIATNYIITDDKYKFLGFNGFGKIQVESDREIYFGFSQKYGIPKRTTCANIRNIKTPLKLLSADMSLFVWLSGLIAIWFLCRTRFCKIPFLCLQRRRARFGTIIILLSWTVLFLVREFFYVQRRIR